MLDTGLVWDGYFCDFDRNFAVGTKSATAVGAHQRLVEATQAGFEAARPGATAADLFHAMDRIGHRVARERRMLAGSATDLACS